MVTAKYRLSFITAVVATVALGWCASGLAQTTAAPAPAAPTTPSAPAPQTSAPPAAPAEKPVSHAHRHVARHRFVERIQTALNGAGATLTVDGRWGPKTTAAMRAFQQQHNLKVTGRPDKETLEALGIHR